MPSGRRSSADREQVVADYQSGMTFEEIRLKHGPSHPTVKRWLKDAGVEPRPRGKVPAPPLDEDKAYGLNGGHWAADARGIQHWVPDNEEKTA